MNISIRDHIKKNFKDSSIQELEDSIEHRETACMDYVENKEDCMKKLFSILFSAIIIFLLSGCTTTKSYTFKVTTNDNIKITLRTNNGYDISSDVPFELNIMDRSFIDLQGFTKMFLLRLLSFLLVA